EERERFRREYDSCRLLKKSKNIVKVFDCDEEKAIAPNGKEIGIQYMVMESLPGEVPAGKITDKNGNIDYDKIIDIALDISSAIISMQKKGIQHRDIKPQNMRQREDGTYVLTDFGLVRVRSAKTLSRAGEIKGTVPYMSPEQAKGERDISTKESEEHEPKSGRESVDTTVVKNRDTTQLKKEDDDKIDTSSDIFSTSAWLLEAVNGNTPVWDLRRPFSSRNNYESLQPFGKLEAIIDKSIDLANWPKCHPALARIILKGLSKDKRFRYHGDHASYEFYRDLLAFKEGKKVKAKVQLKRRVKHWFKDHPKLLTAATAAVLGTAGFATYDAVQKRIEARIETPEKVAYSTFDKKLKEAEAMDLGFVGEKLEMQGLLKDSVELCSKFPNDPRFKQVNEKLVAQYKKHLSQPDFRKSLEQRAAYIAGQLQKPKQDRAKDFDDVLEQFAIELCYQKLSAILPGYDASGKKLFDSIVPPAHSFKSKKLDDKPEFYKILDYDLPSSHIPMLIMAYKFTRDPDFLRYAEEADRQTYTKEAVINFDERNMLHVVPARDWAELYRITGNNEYIDKLMLSAKLALDRKTRFGVLHLHEFPKDPQKRKAQIDGEATHLGCPEFGPSLLANHILLDSYRLTGDEKYLEEFKNLTKIFVEGALKGRPAFIDPVTKFVPHHFYLKMDKSGRITMNSFFYPSDYGGLNRVFDSCTEAEYLKALVELARHEPEKLYTDSAARFANTFMKLTPDGICYTTISPILDRPDTKIKIHSGRYFKAPGFQAIFNDALLALHDSRTRANPEREDVFANEIEAYLSMSL
ncbi:protein kinase, partial [Candidatus Woesearchaeota archaeon]|nr:protein kinase [Candidatus Woesearchaeota archaeon]